MKRGKFFVFGIVLLAFAALLFGGYNIYRYPAMFRSLPDNSFGREQTEKLKNQILSSQEKGEVT